MKERRAALGGALPKRINRAKPLAIPPTDAFGELKKGSGKQQVATTMALVRLFKDLMRDKEIGNRFVPIIPDEARTFGLDAIFPTAKIYSPHGQEYDAVDRELLLSYKESTAGQILHEGISEAGSTASLIAAGTAYATHAQPMIPFYIFYSMFGFQRTGDQFWQFADQLGRGFVLGATAGRTTLTGEGLQHADGHSQLLAATNPAAVAYDPAYAYEIAHIVESGLHRMYGSSQEHPHGEDVFFYLTIYNEPIQQPAEPANVDVEGILRGMHLISPALAEQGRPRAQILASGVAVPWALRAQELLGQDWGVDADVWSVTSWNELRRDGLAADEHNLLNPEDEPRTPYVVTKLAEAPGPVLGVSDYMRQVPDQISQWVATPQREWSSLGADGFGFADTRGAARRFFHIDAESIVVGVLAQLARRGEVKPDAARQALDKYEVLNVAAAEAGSAAGDS